MRIYSLALATAVVGIATFVGGDAKSLMDGNAQKLKDAKSLTVAFTTQPIPGARTTYKLTFGKPNLMKLESDDRLFETDGKTMWDYNKTDKTYTETPFDKDAFEKEVQKDATWTWAPFFVTDAYKKLGEPELGKGRTVHGMKLAEVSFKMDALGEKQGTLLIDEATGLAKGLDLKATSGGNSTETLITATEVKPVDDDLMAANFVWTPPADAKKVEKAVSTGANLTWKDVEPIFTNKCTGCHGGAGGLSCASYDSLMAGGDHGKCVVPGDPDSSSVVGYIKGVIKPRMPKGGRLSDDEIQKISDWIKAGAKK